jgi:hypothetical protein
LTTHSLFSTNVNQGPASKVLDRPEEEDQHAFVKFQLEKLERKKLKEIKRE